MINIINESNNPYFNLALEEYFIKNKDLNDDVLILWQNEPVIVVGKNQNTYEEFNTEYIENNKIKVVRRLSGGGAVYHDLGNLNFTIIKNNAHAYRNDFSFFPLPVIKCLESFGVTALFSGRNDILIDGKKFSGNAQYFYKDKVLHHGALLFSSDLTVLSKALKVKNDKFESKGIKSVQSRVTNICDYVDKNITLSDFREKLVKTMFDYQQEPIKNYDLTADDLSVINELQKSKYSTWEWNYGESPKFNYKKEMRFASGTVSLKMNITDGIINNLKLEGDFFEANPKEALESLFINKRYDSDVIKNIIKKTNVSQYIYKLSNEEFIKLFV